MPRYNITATVHLELEATSTEEAKNLAIAQLDALLPKDFEFSIHALVPSGAKRNPVGEFTLEEVLPFVPEDLKTDVRRDYVVGDQTFSVRMNSMRYFLFRENRTCVSCGLVGVKFLLEHSNGSGVGNPHFNLYAEEDGRLVLMTKDHKLAASNGGSTKFDNLQVMCSICNCLKSNNHLTPEQVLELRKFCTQKRRGLSLRQFNAAMRNLRLQMEAENKRQKIPISGLLTDVAGYNTGEVSQIQVSNPALEEPELCVTLQPKP